MAAWSLVGVLGLGAFALALLVTMPVRFAVAAAGVAIPFDGLSGTIWQGQAKLAGGHVIEWQTRLAESVLAMAGMLDVQVTGPQTALTGRVAMRPTQVVVGPLAGQAAWPLLAAVLPGLQIACDGMADVQIETLNLMVPRAGVGQVTVPEGFCDRLDGTVMRVPVPALVAEIVSVENGIEAVVASDGAPLVTARITDADRALITIHAAGAALVPGMPSSADSEIDLPLALIR